jgi:hypothetical protein
MSNPEDYQPDPDDLTRAQLAETDPMWRAVADTLDEWLHRMHGITSGQHNAGVFLEWLALNGYEVVAKTALPSLAELLPVAVDESRAWQPPTVTVATAKQPALVTASWTHRPRDWAAGVVLRTACGGDVGEGFRVVDLAGLTPLTEGVPLPSLCTVCWASTIASGVCLPLGLIRGTA